MTGFIVTIVIVWFIGGAIWTRVYLGRRCGITYGWIGRIPVTAPGSIPAVLVGIAWPVTIFTHWRPALCGHRRHVLGRAEADAAFAAEQQRFDQARRRETGR